MKKVISLLTVFSIIVTLVATVGITSVSAATANTYKWSYFNSSDKAIYTAYANGTYGGQKFQISSTDTLKNVTYNESMTGVSDEPFLNIISDKYIWNRTEKVTFTKPVMNFNFKMYIPEEDLKSPRQLHLLLSKEDKTSTTPYKNSKYGYVYFTLTSSTAGVYGGTSSSNAERITNESRAVKGNVWHDMSIRVFTNKQGELWFGMYMDGILYQSFKSTAAEIKFDDIGINQMYFATKKNTYIKDIRLDFEDFDPDYAPDAVNYTDVDFEKVTVNSTSKAMSSPSYGKVTTTYQTSTQSYNWYYDSSTTTYKNAAFAGENGALKVTLKPKDDADTTLATIQNFRNDMTSYFPADTTKYMQISYDVKNPADSKGATKTNKWSFGIDTSSNNTNKSVYSIATKMHDNKIWFVKETVGPASYDGDETTRKSVEFEGENDKWYRIISLLKVTNTGGVYNVRVEGYVKDIAADAMYKIYECDETIHKLNGKDGFVLTQQRLDITATKDANPKPVVVYFDNIRSRIWDVDYSANYPDVIDLTANVNKYDIELDCKNNIAVAKVRDLNADSIKLVLAAYDVNGKMVNVQISDANDIIDAEKGIIKLELNTASAGDVKKLKAFVFDDITSAVPIYKHVVFER